jgi:excisionase family DNA binding protein
MKEPQLLRDVLAEAPLLLTPEEAARALRIGRTSLYALMNCGDLRPVHIGRSCRLARSELERYVTSLQAPPPPPAAARSRRRDSSTTDQGGLFELVPNPSNDR